MNIENKGKITVNSKGNIALLGRQVINSVIVKAKLGKIAVGAGDSVTLNFTKNKMINIIIPSQDLDKISDIHGRTPRYLISNEGELRAQGGIIELSASAAKDLRRGTINNADTGSIIATGYDRKSGKITINSQNGRQNLSGRIDVSNKDVKLPSGYVSISGDNIYNKSKISANGDEWGKVKLLSKNLLITASKKIKRFKETI